MRMNRQELLQRLESVQAGLANREVLEQSSCFVFKGGKVLTFNDRIACSQDCPIEFEGAVTAKTFLESLRKLPEDDLDFLVKDEQLVIRGAGRQVKVRREAEVLLPIDTVEIPQRWAGLHEDFAEAVDIVAQCAAKDDENFSLTCVHITPDHIEACDNYQATRFPVPTPLRRDTIVPRDAIKQVVALGMTEYAETKTWLHFRNPAGLVVSVRRYLEDYPNLDELLAPINGTPATLPGSLGEAVARAEVFSAEQADANSVLVELASDRMRLIGRGVSGEYEERKHIKYEGPPISFLIAPKLLTAITDRHTECEIAPGRLQIDTGRFVYVTCLGDVEETAPAPAAPKRGRKAAAAE